MASMMRFQGKFVIPSAHTQSTCLQKQRLILQDSVFVDVVLIDLYLHFKIQSHTYTKKIENNYILPFKSLESVRFFEDVSYSHQSCIYLIRNTVKMEK